VSTSRQQAIVIILVLALILSWLIFEGTGGPNPVRDGFSHVLSPIQFTLGRVARPLVQLLGHLHQLGRLQDENEALRLENASLKAEIIRLQEAAIENETLREQLRFRSAVPEYRLLSAEVIGRDPNNLLRHLVIDRGAADGLERGMPVLTDAGLVGRISQVSASSAQVLLLTDSSSSVSALVQRSRASGIVQGYIGQELIMRYIPQGETIEPGDIVLSSGLGGNFPKRLVIGQVESVENQDAAMFQEARLIPAVNLQELETVMVLLNFVSTEVDAGDAQSQVAPR
jgi:rod shape-determining protein MreC